VQGLSSELGNSITPIQNILDEAQSVENKDSIGRLINRSHNRVQVFSICPAANIALSTNEFWKTSEAGRAFRLMHRATARVLEQFDFAAHADRIRLAEVTSLNEILWSETFKA
jgi:hypothetical protein